MTLHLRPISDAGRSPAADFLHVSLNRWRAKGNLASRVIGGVLADPELKSHRDHAGAIVANRLNCGASCRRHRLDCLLLCAAVSRHCVHLSKGYENHAHPDAPPAIDPCEGAG